MVSPRSNAGIGRAAPALLTLLAACTGPVPDLMRPGVSHELAEYRGARLSHVRYTLALDVTGRDTARGHVVVTFDRRGTGDVIFDFRGPALSNGTVNGTPLAVIDYNGAHIRIPAARVRAGANAVTFDFTALIAPSGASITRFHDTEHDVDYLYTLLVPADANQLFPCFDQPDLKARVTLALTVPSGWSGVANGALGRQEAGSAGATTFRFAETEPISTYLIAFAAGPWSRVTRTAYGRTITMYVRTSRADEAEGEALIAANARAARWLEAYFGVPFPFQKLDFVLAPAFPFGGMEHPGAIFYNEDRFIFRERPTTLQLLGREETIYHEVAHQWFGDLVTMRWFDDLWLKEGFATYTAAKMQAALDTASVDPQSSDAWKRFFLRHKPSAYEVDGSKGTVAVWQPLDNLDQAKSNYGAIVYNKAPGILKQLNYLVGDSAFRAGVQAFLTKHAYANATWQDLLDAIGTAAGRSLDDWGAQYIRRPGMPVLEQHLRVRDGQLTGVTLRQRPARALSGTGVWPLRAELSVSAVAGLPVRRPITMHHAELAVALPPGVPASAFVFANAGDHGYVSVLLDTLSAHWLLTHVGDLTEPLLRAMGWESLWDVVRDGRLAPARYLATAIRELPDEADEQIAASLLGHATRTATAYLSCAAADTLRPKLTTMLRHMVMDTGRPYGIRRASLNALVAVARAGEDARGIEALLDRSIPGLPLGAPTRWAIVTKLVELATPTAEHRLAEETARDSTTDGRRRAFVAGAAQPNAAVKQVYFARYLTDSTLNEDWASSSLYAFNSVSASALTLPYLRPALDTLRWIQQHRRIFFLGAWLGAFFDGQVSEDALQRAEALLQRSPELPDDLRRKVLQAMDELERTVAIRRRWGGGDGLECPPIAPAQRSGTPP